MNTGYGIFNWPSFSPRWMIENPAAVRGQPESPLTRPWWCHRLWCPTEVSLRGHLNLSHVLLELHRGAPALSPGGLWSYNLNLDFPLPRCAFLGFNCLSPLWRPVSQWDANEGLCHLSPGLLECHHEADRTNWSHRHRQ